MTASPATSARGPRDRPPGLAPRGTAWGFGAIMALALVSPAGGLLGSADWLPIGLEGLMGGAFASIVFGGVCFLPLAVGLPSRRFWMVAWYFWAGVLCLAVYALALAMTLAVPLHLVRTVHPELRPVVWVGRAMLVLAAPMAVPLVRALRLNYWRPWTTTESWEVGDERMAGWVRRAAGVPPVNDPAKRP